MTQRTANQTGTREGSASGRRVRLTTVTMSLLCALVAAGPTPAGPLDLFGPKGDSSEQQRTTIQKESAAMLDELYAAKPELRERLKKAAGYATFKKTDIHLLLVASGNGYGVLVDNKTGKKSYMRVASLGGGVGMGVSDLRVIFVFNDAAVMQQFADKGWQFGGDANASAKYQDVGANVGQTAKANVNVKDGTVDGGTSTDVKAGAGDGKTKGQSVAIGGPMEVYQFTESGISLQATVSGTKYWKDADINN